MSGRVPPGGTASAVACGWRVPGSPRGAAAETRRARPVDPLRPRPPRGSGGSCDPPSVPLPARSPASAHGHYNHRGPHVHLLIGCLVGPCLKAINRGKRFCPVLSMSLQKKCQAGSCCSFPRSHLPTSPSPLPPHRPRGANYGPEGGKGIAAPSLRPRPARGRKDGPSEICEVAGEAAWYL